MSVVNSPFLDEQNKISPVLGSCDIHDPDENLSAMDSFNNTIGIDGTLIAADMDIHADENVDFHNISNSFTILQSSSSNLNSEQNLSNTEFNFQHSSDYPPVYILSDDINTKDIENIHYDSEECSEDYSRNEEQNHVELLSQGVMAYLNTI